MSGNHPRGNPDGRSDMFSSSALGDQKGGNYGRGKTLSPGESIGLIRNNSPDQNLHLVTCLLGVNPVDTNQNRVRGTFTAKLSFGVGGASHIAFATVHQGTLITVACSALNVDVTYEQNPDPAEVLPDTETVNVTCSTVWGTRPTSDNAPVSFDIPVVALASGSAVVIPIPPFAKLVSVFSDALASFTAAAGTHARLRGSRAADFNDYDSLSVAYNLRGMQVNADHAFFELTNNSGAARNYVVRFGLAL